MHSIHPAPHSNTLNLGVMFVDGRLFHLTVKVSGHMKEDIIVKAVVVVGGSQEGQLEDKAGNHAAHGGRRNSGKDGRHLVEGLLLGGAS